ncbi:hypothetical protein C8239_07060 [Paracidovorax avenae]|uniref:hypothetical protein n=1 Tax=Paracidovorax avenae TaxID=80867 RepID=UPI000D208233|nr:hypothetical protein [Paracidovorax avenae]AVS84554.1 hypothetical protein C8239_07060 [Paracidovorax avenae]
MDATTAPDAPARTTLPAFVMPPDSPGEPFDARALLARYVLRDFSQAVAEVEQALLASQDDGANASAEAPGEEARREFARQFVAGAWLNRHNPGWDPRRPETHQPLPDDPLVALLQEMAGREAGATA